MTHESPVPGERRRLPERRARAGVLPAVRRPVRALLAKAALSTSPDQVLSSGQAPWHQNRTSLSCRTLTANLSPYQRKM
jgi:hypothetical protein